MDINLAGEMDGITQPGSSKKKIDVSIIFLTAFATDTMITRAKLTKPFGYILKPYSETQIWTSIEIALFNHSLERQLKDRDATIQMLINTTEDSLMLLDPSGIVQFVNESMAITIGKDPDEMIGMKLEELKAEETLSEPVFELVASAMTGKYGKKEYQINDLWKEYTCIPVLDIAKNVIRIGFYCHDISVRKKSNWIYTKQLTISYKRERCSMLQERKFIR